MNNLTHMILIPSFKRLNLLSGCWDLGPRKQTEQILHCFVGTIGNKKMEQE